MRLKTIISLTVASALACGNTNAESVTMIKIQFAEVRTLSCEL